MEIRLLGPLQARENGHSITPTANKPRQLLALLAMRPGELVTMAELIEELWDTKACRSAVQCLQTYVLRLREVLAAALPPGGAMAKEVLITRPCGYTLHISAEQVDVYRYQQLVTAGDAAMDVADYESASNLLGSALRWWRGSALVDVRTGPRLDIEVARLEQSRLSVLESRIDADLGLGRHHQLLGELTELTKRYPMHEKLCARYMIALTVSGCRWRALEVFWTLRQKLVSELGVEPSAEVQRLQQAILNSDSEAEMIKPAMWGPAAVELGTWREARVPGAHPEHPSPLPVADLHQLNVH
jgi:DNA-binding SARP family transcriptional activator